jgi:uncharacterized sulfatase
MKRIVFFALLLCAGAAGVYAFRLPLLLQIIEWQSGREFGSLPEAPALAWNGGRDNRLSDHNRPNVILIVADDLGYNDISTFGGGVAEGRVATPNIDRLAAEGTVFQQSYSGASTCAPSRAMMLTGRYPTRTGYEFTPTPPGMSKLVSGLINKREDYPKALYDAVLDESQPPFESKGLPTDELTLAEVLRDHGYYTAHIGKWHLGRTQGMDPNSQGFHDSLLMQSGLYLPAGDARGVDARLDFDPIDQFLWARFGFSNTYNTIDEQRFKPKSYLTDYWTDEAVSMIEKNVDRPFFLYLAHWGVHTPLQASKEDYEAVGDIMPRLRVYAAMIRALDRSVGRVLDVLEREGLSDNTLVVFTSDNGGPGYLGLNNINKPYRGWKITQFEGGIRVPMFVRWPGTVPRGGMLKTPVAHIDLMPTIADLTQSVLLQDRAIDGLSLAPLLRGQVDTLARDALFWQNGHYQTVRQGDWKLQVNNQPDLGQVVWLFNLASDPYEINNVANQYPDKVGDLRALLEEHNRHRRPALYPAAAELPVLIDKTLIEPYEQGDELVYTPN